MLFREELHCEKCIFDKSTVKFWQFRSVKFRFPSGFVAYTIVSNAKYAKSTNMLLSKMMIDNWSLMDVLWTPLLYNTFRLLLTVSFPMLIKYIPVFIFCTHFIQNTNTLNYVFPQKETSWFQNHTSHQIRACLKSERKSLVKVLRYLPQCQCLTTFVLTRKNLIGRKWIWKK